MIEINDKDITLVETLELILHPEAKKPKVAYRQYFCPECESKLIAYNWTGGIHYCHHCGQAIDWNNEKEML